jgi:hypothetical protein
MAKRSDWVLVAGDSRGAVAAVRALAAAGYRVGVTVSGRGSMAAASRSCHRRVPVPDAVADPAGFAAAVRRELASRTYLAMLPATDPAIVALELPAAALMDKEAWAPLARAAGLEVPPTEVFESRAALLAAAGRLAYPAIAKPSLKRFTATRLGQPADIGRLPDVAARILVQPFLDDQLHGVIGLAWRGEIVAAAQFRYERVWPFPCGTMSAAVTVDPDDRLLAGFASMLTGFDGIFHADLAGPYLLDLNPRIHAALPLAEAAGARLIEAYCELMRGGSSRAARGRAGVRFRWIEGDMRSIIRAFRDGRLDASGALGAIRPRRGDVLGVESLRDPLPMLQRFHRIPGYIARRLPWRSPEDRAVPPPGSSLG